MSSNYLLKVLQKYHGLIDVTTKVPVRDRYSLSLVYTPGVGQACMEIKKNVNEVLSLTNKANSIIIITDGSAFPVKSDQANFHMLPFIETLAVFYKQVYNIDAYPMVLDREKDENLEDVLDAIYNLSPAYAGFELYGFDPIRIEKLMALWDKKPIQAAVLNSIDRELIEKNVNIITKSDPAKTGAIIAGLIRAALDLGVYQRFSSEVIARYLEEITSDKYIEVLRSDNLYNLAKSAVLVAAKNLIGANLATVKMTPEQVRDKLDTFYLEGQEGWVKHTALDYMSLMNTIEENSIELHRAHGGVTSVETKVPIKDPSFFKEILNAENQREVSEKIIADPAFAYDSTCKGNLCAIISNGTAVLGFGDIGAEAGLPVMEGKSVLFKQLAGVDVMPICIREKDPKKVIEVISRFAPSFAAINLEDIKAPDCFEIEKTLIDKLDIPVFHDDQHGTAVVCTAAFLNSLKLLGKKPEEVKVVINGGGAAGISITELMLHAGAKNVVVCDTKGAIYKGRPTNMNPFKDYIASISNPNNEKGDLPEILKGADFFIGVSVAGALKPEWIKNMNEKPVIFALANPIPEIMPEEAKKAGAFIVATGRSDFKNQVNNSLVFPGLFRGAIDIRARKITMRMKMAAAIGIASLIKEQDLNPDFIIPGALDPQVPLLVAKKVAEAGIEEGVARKIVNPELVAENLKYFMVHGRFNYEKSLNDFPPKKPNL